MKKSKQKLVKKAFSIIGEELSNIEDAPVVLNFSIGNFRKEGFDILFQIGDTEGEVWLINYLKDRIRLDNKIWFDSGFSTDGNLIEWNFDWSLDEDGE
jgi:hypothetical protein